MEIRRATIDDVRAVAWLACLLWPYHTLLEMEEEMEKFLKDSDSAIFLAVEDGATVGFAQSALRHDYVEGSDRSPCGYLEGIYVMEAYRSRGFASELLKSCEDWARGQHCFQFASDCEISNNASLIFHLKCGFCEANRIVCFIKDL